MCSICPWDPSPKDPLPKDPLPKDPSPKDPSLACCPTLNLLKVLNVLEVLNVLNTPKDPSLACWALFLFFSFYYFSYFFEEKQGPAGQRWVLGYFKHIQNIQQCQIWTASMIFLKKIVLFWHLKKTGYRPTNGPSVHPTDATDGRMDTPSYRKRAEKQHRRALNCVAV